MGRGAGCQEKRPNSPNILKGVALQILNFDVSVKSRHSGGYGVQESCEFAKELDSGSRRNDRKTKIRTFYTIINFI